MIKMKNRKLGVARRKRHKKKEKKSQLKACFQSYETNKVSVANIYKYNLHIDVRLCLEVGFLF